jgi:hypothetical protein
MELYYNYNEVKKEHPHYYEMTEEEMEAALVPPEPPKEWVEVEKFLIHVYKFTRIVASRVVETNNRSMALYMVKKEFGDGYTYKSEIVRLKEKR